LQRARGGGVKHGPAFDEGLRAGTQVQHAPGKMDGKDIDRGPVITRKFGGSIKDKSTPERYELDTEHDKVERATGGPVEHPVHGGMAPDLHAGAGGGLGRLRKAARERHHG
jgi:hypothetical protein